jgi:quercetin dioxygenase-like cupin family protein
MKKLLPIVIVASVLLGLACGSENKTEVQNKSPNVNSGQKVNENKTADKSETDQGNEKITNIEESLKFNDEKPAILSIINSEKLNLKTVGLKKGQIMSKHKAGLKSLVIVLKGKIEFDINGEKFVLNELDTYEIPVNVEHEIRGIEQSIFSLTQEK